MPPRPRQKLTAKILATLKPGEIARDEVVRGFFAEAGANGVSLRVRVDFRPGERTGELRKRTNLKITLGRHGNGPGLVTLDAARAEAMRILSGAKKGKDPRAPVPTGGAWTVGRMRDEYLRDLDIRERSERTANDLRDLFRRYLEDWFETPAADVTKDMVRERHARISAEHGRFAANHAMRALRTCFNFTIAKTNAELASNPVDAVTFHKERPRKDRPDFHLPPVTGWLAKVRALKSPLRRTMHELQLFTGLRPSNVTKIEKAWLRLDVSALVIPAHAMKGRKTFACPLSAHAIVLIREALAAGDVLEKGSPFLFPSRDRNDKVIATASWKEKKIPEVGHIVRHMYSAAAATVLKGDDVDRELLLAHTIPGVRGVYLDVPSLFARLLAAQELITAHLLAQAPPPPTE